MIGGPDCLAGLHEIGLERLLAAVTLVQDRVEVQFGEREQPRLMAALAGAAGIGLAQSPAEAVRNRIADDDGDPGHGALPFCMGDSARLRSRF